MSGDFIYGIINSLDGERDPRNLDFIFTFMPNFIQTYPLLHLSEEMFEVFACYFPIDFNPTKNDPDTITRENLASKLTQCLVASPEFVEWTVALALEKLESDLVVAKCDSLELLYQAALKFPCDLLESHFEQIWIALKNELFPGSENTDVVSYALRTLRCILEQATAASKTDISHNYQTIILGTILPHLSDVNHRLFNSASTIALVCVAGDPVFASEKILNTFLIKLNENPATLNDDQCIRIYNIIAQMFNIISLKGETVFKAVNTELCSQMHSHIIASLKKVDAETDSANLNLDLLKVSLVVLIECAPIISEANRVMVYRILMSLLTNESTDLEQTQPLLERLGALYPIELQSNCIDGCIKNFGLFSNFVKEKILSNLIPLVRQIAFTQRILDLLYQQIFGEGVPNDVRLLSLQALNCLLKTEDERFVQDLQNNSELIDKLVQLALNNKELNSEVLTQIARALSAIVQTLSIAEQYMIATSYLCSLNLQLESDLYVAEGLLGYLHKDISLDDHFERLLNDLTQLSLQSENEGMREVAHHLLCSLVNKIEYNDNNRGIIKRTIHKLAEAIKKENKKAVEALSWLGKGLVMRGSNEAGEIVETLSELLDHPSLSNAASLAFEIISSEYPQLHLPQVKFLFQQKFFHMILSKLGHKLEQYCENHLTAFVYVLKATPHAVLKMNIEKIGPILFKCLESGNVHTQGISLQICENFVKHQDDYFRSHLNHLIPASLKLTTCNHSMKLRISALKLLYDITKYPTFVLLPYKVDVVLDLATALDDPKRLVRNAAVQARNAWYMIGAPKTE
uniref:MMS19 nucleotide excision repair protein n=1 Tax=Musca domestica TaxID=7370 RepID=T1P948_MUSDO